MKPAFHMNGLLGPMLALLAAVALPTAGVLWFMSQAVRNERLAVRQRLTQDYESRLDFARKQFQALWVERARDLAGLEADEAPSSIFSRLVGDGLCDGLILSDPNGAVAYPLPPALPLESEGDGKLWAEAARLEYQGGTPAKAAQAYERLARDAPNVHLEARALLARARCLARAEEIGPALAALTGALAQERFERAVDGQGRLIAPNALLLALQLTDATGHVGAESLAAALRARLLDYADDAMPSSQRVFLMRCLAESANGDSLLPMLHAEELGLEMLEAGLPPLREGRLVLTSVEGVWAMALPGAQRVALFRQSRLVGELPSLLAEGTTPHEAEIRLLPPVEDPPERTPFLSRPAAAALPGWTLALDLSGPDPFAAAARAQTALDLWCGALIVVLFAALAVAMAVHFGKQMRLARLKSDLIATVSHELKTPLSSMRVLVDTLLEGRCPGPDQEREYLEMIARENARLSRLIDNFLTFSRMERNKRAFEFAPVEPRAIVDDALEAVRERFEAAGCDLQVDVADALPPLDADRDALTTALLNLLDNAFKYTEGRKRIAVNVRSENNGVVRFEVSDNGIGLSPRDAKKIFDRFYQVDQRLTRETSGCGLGLSIVRFIVEAHGGTVEVSSRPGQGSVFTMAIPARG
jgi:signal transduction histidine kinase